MHLSLETRWSGEIIIIHCEGRVVYGDEVRALSRVVGKALQHTRGVVLNLAGVRDMDSAGLGELVLAQMSAENDGKTLGLVAVNTSMRRLLDLTNLSSVLGIYDSVDEAVAAQGKATPVM